MEFQSIKNIYTAIRLADGNDQYKTYMCRRDDIFSECYLLCISDRNIKLDFCRYIAAQEEAGSSEWLKEVFTDKSDLCVVFEKEDAGVTVKAVAGTEDYSLRDRLDVLYRVLEGICIANMPEPFACDLLEHDNIGVKSDGTVGTRMILTGLSDYALCDMEKFNRLFADKLRYIMKKSDDIRFEETDRFMDSLEKKPAHSYIELFERYKEVYLKLADRLEKGDFARKNLLGGILSFLKKAVPIVKTIFAILIVIAAIILIVYAASEKQPENGGDISRIGKVWIQEYEGTQE